MTRSRSSCMTILLTGSLLIAACESPLTIDDESGIMGQTMSPVVKSLSLKQNQIEAAKEGRLGLIDKEGKIIPVQWELQENELKSTAVLLMPNSASEKHQLKWHESQTGFETSMMAILDSVTGQINITDQGNPVMRYIYQTVYEDDEFAFNGLTANEYVAMANDTFMAKPSIYAVPRSDYIHPLYGLNGEILTRDWAKDHPHHRGIYWAWPEVGYGRKQGDIHALQKVFARPTGKIKLQNGPVFAQIKAENLWIWEEEGEENMPIVKEHVLIRAYHQTEHGRIIDMILQFEGLKDSITIARRHTDAYGGLNIRMMSAEDQEISFFTDEPDTVPRRAWSDLSGGFVGNGDVSGLMVFQHSSNPEYPGDWVYYPDLSWVQPTFPTSGTRYTLEPGKPLLLQFRLVIHTGAKPDDGLAKMLWDALHSKLTPQPKFIK